jgi:hypothetical protein
MAGENPAEAEGESGMQDSRAYPWLDYARRGAER